MHMQKCPHMSVSDTNTPRIVAYLYFLDEGRPKRGVEDDQE